MRCVIIGGLGFVGSHFVDKLLSDPATKKLTLFDNLSNGRMWHVWDHQHDKRLKLVIDNIENFDELKNSMKKSDLVIHLASNADISKATIEPTIDFWQGTALTNYVLEAMRQTGVKRLLYASGSGVYGDCGNTECIETQGNMHPTSTYGASKLAGETLISSYCHMFGMSACAFRFGNIIGARQTHGIGFDFAKRLTIDPTKLTILGNGTQSKSYVHVSDIVNAVLLANEKLTSSFEVYNVATGDYITVKEITELCLECMGLSDKTTQLTYGNGNKGWAGDVPIIKLNTDKIKALGWKPTKTSYEAIKSSIFEMLPDIKSGKM